MFGFFIWILFWLLVPALIWRFRSNHHMRGGRGMCEPTALDILKTRYAKGEVNKAQFDEMKTHIA
jgi:uncharacterized membrane protein